MPDSISELDDITWRLENIFREDPSLMRKWKPKIKRLEEVATNVSRVHKLCAKWPSVPQSLLLEFSTQQSAPFIRLCIGLAERKYTVVPMSLMLWWRRMLGCGQDSVITFFSWQSLDRLQVTNVTGNDILRACTDNQELLKNIGNTLDEAKNVDFRIRELLGGLGANTDVRAAWKKWVMRNHPDKGGDPENFLRVKVVYDEWLSLNNTQQ